MDIDPDDCEPTGGGYSGWLRFPVPGRPQSKQRPRLGGEGQVYTPSETTDYEGMVTEVAEVAKPGSWPMDGSYELQLAILYPDARFADVDNVAKSITDGLQGVLWHDDRDVMSVHAVRHVVDELGEGGVWVAARPVSAPSPPSREILDHFH